MYIILNFENNDPTKSFYALPYNYNNNSYRVPGHIDINEYPFSLPNNAILDDYIPLKLANAEINFENKYSNPIIVADSIYFYNEENKKYDLIRNISFNENDVINSDITKCLKNIESLKIKSQNVTIESKAFSICIVKCVNRLYHYDSLSFCLTRLSTSLNKSGLFVRTSFALSRP